MSREKGQPCNNECSIRDLCKGPRPNPDVEGSIDYKDLTLDVIGQNIEDFLRKVDDDKLLQSIDNYLDELEIKYGGDPNITLLILKLVKEIIDAQPRFALLRDGTIVRLSQSVESRRVRVSAFKKIDECPGRQPVERWRRWLGGQTLAACTLADDPEVLLVVAQSRLSNADDINTGTVLA